MIEEEIKKKLQSKIHEKTLIDKLLGRQEAEELKTLISKKNLNREELLKVMNIISGVQSKLLNLSPKDRHILLKFFAWLREYVMICLQFLDVKEIITKEIINEEPKKVQHIKELTLKIGDLLEHVAKGMIDFYLNICSTSMSINGSFVGEAFKNKFEVDYRNTLNQNTQKETKSVLGKW